MRNTASAVLVGLLGIAAVLGVAGCSGSGSSSTSSSAGTTVAADPNAPPTEKPEDALKRRLTEQFSGQWGPLYDDLVPAQQALINKDVYVKCSQDETPPGNLNGVEIVSTYTENVLIPGTSEHADSTAITAKVTFDNGLGKQAVTDTFHEFAVVGAWRHAIDKESAVAAYAAGNCPSTIATLPTLATIPPTTTPSSLATIPTIPPATPHT